MDKQKTLLQKFKEKPFWDKFVLGLIFMAIIGTLAYHFIKDYNVKTNKKHVVGKIVDFEFINMARYSIDYEYYVNDEKYVGTVGVERFDCYKNKECLGYEVDVYYSSENPNYSQVDLRNFEKYKRTIYLIK
ncbi:hypothetical protein [Maribacter aestuarii]|uniref:hypothetical protein n=1 Tax=Maribacter aestuarii TaxID=1130723 RepID=UPI00248B7D10|nr:hypothetical protein [Maribacter aestuarii]